MANSKGEGSNSNPNDEQILKDLVSKVIAEQIKKLLEKMNQLLLEALISNMKQNEEQFKKLLEKLEEKQRDYESVRSAMRNREEMKRKFAELITKPELREAVIKAFKKEKEASNGSSSTVLEMLIESFKGYVKNHKEEEIAGQENCEDCRLEELLNKLSEIAQQVIDLKDP